MEKVNVNNEFIRRAIWEVYNGRCFYTGDPLDYSDMQLDHIIPSSYRSMPDKLKDIIYECGLDEDFELDSLYNLVPTTRYENRRKSNMNVSHTTKMHYFSITKEKVPAIIKKIEQLKKRRDYNEHLAILKNHLDEQKEESEREKLLHSIISYMSNESEFIAESQEYLNIEDEIIFKKYTQRIGLEAIMPKYNNPETTCIISFRNIKHRNTILVLNNKIILNQLFSGLFTDPKYRCRDFAENQDVNQDNQEILNLDNCIIQLGNSKLRLLEDDIYELCEVIDAYACKYIQCILDIEHLIKTHEFPLSKRRNNYKLITLKHSEWRKLVEFAIRHDVDNGSSQWHIFDRNAYYIKVYTNKRNQKYNYGYHAFFHAEYNEDIVLYPDMTPKELIVTWELIEDIDNIGPKCINRRQNWDAEIAYDWLVNKFMPKALGYSNFNIIGSLVNRKINKGIDRIVYLENKEIATIKDLSDMVSRLQVHYHIHPHNKYRICKEDLKGIYNSIRICLRCALKIDIYYICSKLYLHHCNSVIELTDSIIELTENIEDSTINGFGIDFLFRGLLSALESEYINLSIEDIRLIRKNISYFVELYDREVMLDKYALEFV